jgi:hypothetical protein
VKHSEESLKFANFAGFLKKLKEHRRASCVHTIPKIVLTVWRLLWERYLFSYTKIYIYIYTMVMNIRSGSQANWQMRLEPKQIPPPFPPLGGGDQDRIAALEAQLATLMQQNVELLKNSR